MRYQTTNSATPYSNSRSLRKTQSGFSVFELLISMAITLIAVVAAVGLMTKFARTVGAFTEVSTMEEARGTSETLLRADFDGAGRNLTRPSPPLAGTIFATPNSFNFYTWSNGTITKTGPNGWENPVDMTHALASGLGSWTFTPPAQGASAYISGPNGGSFAIVIGFGSQEGGVPISIFVNGVDMTGTSSVSPHLAGDSYTIKIENGLSQRVAKIYRVRNNVQAVLWTSSAPVPSYPIAFALNLFSQSQSFSNVRITGAPLIALTGNQTEFATLPSDNNTPLTAPITTTGGGTGVIILSGDTTTDATATVAAFSQTSTEIVARTPQRGFFKTGDYVLIIDWGSLDPSSPGGNASALCMVTSVTTNADRVTLSTQRVRQSNAAWARLWSTDADHAHTFAAGSTLTKLQAPVSYALSNDSRLVRIEGNRVSTLAFKFRRANFNRYVEFNSTAMMFQVEITLAAEGVESNATTSEEARSTIEFRSTPRALNLASNQLN